MPLRLLLMICFVYCRYVASENDSKSSSERKALVRDAHPTYTSHDPRIEIPEYTPTDVVAVEVYNGSGDGNNISVSSHDNNNNPGNSDIVNIPAENEKTEEVKGQISKTGIPQTERTGSRRLGAWRNKSGRPQVGISDLTADDLPRHGALVHQTNYKPDSGQAQFKLGNNEESSDRDPNLDLDDSEKSYQRKRRIPSSSATPSVQIVILVIGAVLGCVLLTGFVRWRVRARLEAMKAKERSDDFVIVESRPAFPGSSSMDTIYECEEALFHNKDTKVPPLVPDEDDTTFDDLYSSHRFDLPGSIMSQTYSASHHTRLHCPSSPKSGRDLRLIRGGRRQTITRHRHGHKGRYARHQRKRLQNAYVQKLETIPMETRFPSNDDNEGPNSATPLLGHQDGSERDDASVKFRSSPYPPLLSRKNSPPPARSILTSLLNTWRSLSFNRDWVGKMWQEQHNIRRISDVLRGMTSGKESDIERTPPESPFSIRKGTPPNSPFRIRGCTPPDSPFTIRRLTSRGGPLSNQFSFSETSLSSHGSNPKISENKESNATSVSETVLDVAGLAALTEEKPMESHRDHNWLSYILDETTDLSTHWGKNTTGCVSDEQTESAHSFWPITACQEEPVVYGGMRDDHMHSPSFMESDDEHPRFQRIHIRRLSDEREIMSRHYDSPSTDAHIQS